MTNSNITKLNEFVLLAKKVGEFIPHQMSFITDKDFKIIYCAQSFSRLTKINVGEILNQETFNARPHGLNFDIEVINQAIINVFHDRKKRYICQVISQQSSNVNRLVDLYLGPIMNKDTGEVIAVIIQVMRFKPAFKIEMVFSAVRNINPNIKEEEIEGMVDIATNNLTRSFAHAIKLTEREENVVFLLLMFYSSREIADILSKIEHKIITKDSIDKLITNQLQVKFNSIHRHSLVRKLITLQYHNHVPKAFIKQFSKKAVLLD